MNQLFVASALVASLGIVSVSAAQNSTPAPAERLKGTVVRGCLAGSRLTRVEPAEDSDVPFPDSLGINAIRVIRSQLKALNGHQVELIGTVDGLGPQNGILVSDSEKLKVYLGGSDPNFGDDSRRPLRPTFYARTIRDIAPTCTTQAQ